MRNRSAMRVCGVFLLALLVTLTIDAPARAQAVNYPVRPIRFIVTYSPGGPADILARALAQKMSDRLGQQVLVDNRPGGGGNIGAEVAAGSAPDGYTLFQMTSTPPPT